MRRLMVILAIVAISLGGSGVGVAMAGNPHCAGNSDNVNLPSGHVNNFPGCE